MDSDESSRAAAQSHTGLRAAPRSESRILRAGRGEPLVLLHGVTGSSTMWRRVVPLLSPHHDVIAPTALGHRGGAPVRLRPTQLQHVVDDAERSIDELGFDRVHLAGNSMGGWVALELARRERALSVCALSPAGVWIERGGQPAANKLREALAMTRRSRRILPLLAQSALFRRFALRDNAAHGERVSAAELLELADDLLGCEVSEDIFSSSEQLMPLSPSCPVTLAWSGADRIFPVRIHAARARELVPEAHFMLLDGVGHVPMLDDPQLVAATILEATRAAQERGAARLQPHAE